jgi:hypothetical protein
MLNFGFRRVKFEAELSNVTWRAKHEDVKISNHRPKLGSMVNGHCLVGKNTPGSSFDHDNTLYLLNISLPELSDTERDAPGTGNVHDISKAIFNKFVSDISAIVSS